MKERTHTNDASFTNEEPWPAIEAQWPSARWMSPWAFQGDESDAGDSDDTERDGDRARH